MLPLALMDFGSGPICSLVSPLRGMRRCNAGMRSVIEAIVLFLLDWSRRTAGIIPDVVACTRGPSTLSLPQHWYTVQGHREKKSMFDPQPVRSTCQAFVPSRNAIQRLFRAGDEC